MRGNVVMTIRVCMFKTDGRNEVMRIEMRTTHRNDVLAALLGSPRARERGYDFPESNNLERRYYEFVMVDGFVLPLLGEGLFGCLLSVVKRFIGEAGVVAVVSVEVGQRTEPSVFRADYYFGKGSDWFRVNLGENFPLGTLHERGEWIYSSSFLLPEMIARAEKRIDIFFETGFFDQGATALALARGLQAWRAVQSRLERASVLPDEASEDQIPVLQRRMRAGTLAAYLKAAGYEQPIGTLGERLFRLTQAIAPL